MINQPEKRILKANSRGAYGVQLAEAGGLSRKIAIQGLPKKKNDRPSKKCEAGLLYFINT